MTTRFREALAARLAGRKSGDAGFTLIELLVVVLIIGILAAIAIPIFLSQQASAKDSAAKADLGSAKTATISYATTHTGTYPTAITDLTSEGFTPTANDNVTYIGAVSSTHLCISATVTGSSNTFYVTDTSGVSTTACS